MLVKDFYGDVDELQFIDVFKLVSKDIKVSVICIKGKQLWIGLVDNINFKVFIFNFCYYVLF